MVVVAVGWEIKSLVYEYIDHVMDEQMNFIVHFDWMSFSDGVVPIYSLNSRHEKRQETQSLSIEYRTNPRHPGHLGGRQLQPTRWHLCHTLSALITPHLSSQGPLPAEL